MFWKVYSTIGANALKYYYRNDATTIGEEQTLYDEPMNDCSQHYGIYIHATWREVAKSQRDQEGSLGVLLDHGYSFPWKVCLQ